MNTAVAIDDLTNETLRALRLSISQLENTKQLGQNASAARRALQRLEQRLQRPFMFALTGEFNTGKSTLCNKLAEVESLPTALFASTHVPTCIHYAEQPEIFGVTDDFERRPLSSATLESSTRWWRIEIGLPVERLRRINLLDMPGLGDPQFEHSYDAIAEQGVDAIIWCTAMTQAWKESERAAWAALPQRLQERTILAITFSDLILEDADRQRVVERVLSQDDAEFAHVVIIMGGQPTAAPSPTSSSDDGSAHPDDLSQLITACETLAMSVQLERLRTAARVVQRVLQRS